tara:strand:- start:1088 stop:1408 length:321 start_codon:yes stop_codon:yes gene_type:complete
MEIVKQSKLIKVKEKFILKHKTDSDLDLTLLGFVTQINLIEAGTPYDKGGCDIDIYQVRERAIYEDKKGKRHWEYVPDLLFMNCHDMGSATRKYDTYHNARVRKSS